MKTSISRLEKSILRSCESFSCPHCNAVAHQDSIPGGYFGPDVSALRRGQCPLGLGCQRLEIRNDVAPMLGVWNADNHFCSVNIGRGVLQEFIQRLLVPRDVCRFQGRREIVAGYGSALAADNPGE